MALVLALLALGCTHGPKPCLGPASCPADAECLAARCMPEGSAPVTPSTRRLSLVPAPLALVAGERAEAVGPSVVLGSRDSDAALYLRFSPLWRGQRIEAAFLVLQPMPATLGGDDVPLQVLRVRGAWGAPQNVRGAQPALALPAARGIGRSFPGLPIRIDVTSIVRFLALNPDRDQGLAVRAVASVPPGLTIATGFDGGRPPRLELYVLQPTAN